MTLKKLIYNLLKETPELRDSDRKLIWRVWEIKGAVFAGFLSYESFINAPSPETVRRCRQSLQRTDKLTGKNLIQPTKKVEKYRLDQAKLLGYNFIQGQESFI